MMKKVSSGVFLVFDLLCVSAAIALTCYWVYVFTLNEDLCTVDYKKYYGREEDVYPVLSLCLANPIANEKLKKANPRANASSYLKFLKGEVFDPNLMSINYSTIIQNLAHYIEEDFIRYRNGSYIAMDPDYEDSVYVNNVMINKNKRKFYVSSAFFYYSRFYNCYELSMPHDKNITEIYFRVNNSIFPSGSRPTMYGLLTILHYPNQLLTASYRKHVWPQKRNAMESYEMRFNIRGIEVLRRRNKRNFPCNENWKDHDNYIKKKYVSALGCRPPYLDYVGDIPPCWMKEQMKEYFYFRQDGYGVNPSCREMKKVFTWYHENTWTVEKGSWGKRGFFFIGIKFYGDDFKEINQIRYLF